MQIKDSRVYRYDVRDPDDPKKVFAQIRSQLGPVEILVYNAGAGAFANIDDATPEDFQSAWEVNARGLFLLSAPGNTTVSPFNCCTPQKMMLHANLWLLGMPVHLFC